MAIMQSLGGVCFVGVQNLKTFSQKPPNVLFFDMVGYGCYDSAEE